MLQEKPAKNMDPISKAIKNVRDLMLESSDGKEIEVDMTAFGGKEKVRLHGLGLTWKYMNWVMRRLIMAIFNHFNELRYFRADMSEARCKATSQTHNGLIKWESGKCYNPLLHELTSNTGNFAGAIGIVKRVLLPKVVRAIMSGGNDMETAGVMTLMKALYGEDYIAKLPQLTQAQLREELDRMASSEGNPLSL
jgi:hypothetical protein